MEQKQPNQSRYRKINELLKKTNPDEMIKKVKMSKLFGEIDRRMRLPFLPNVSLVKTGAVLKAGFFVVSAGIIGYKYMYPTVEQPKNVPTSETSMVNVKNDG